jgi:hypothetical protein
MTLPGTRRKEQEAQQKEQERQEQEQEARWEKEWREQEERRSGRSRRRGWRRGGMSRRNGGRRSKERERSVYRPIKKQQPQEKEQERQEQEWKKREDQQKEQEAITIGALLSNRHSRMTCSGTPSRMTTNRRTTKQKNGVRRYVSLSMRRGAKTAKKFARTKSYTWGRNVAEKKQCWQRRGGSTNITYHGGGARNGPRRRPENAFGRV